MFEKRKATMFKRWDRMAKAFTRCGKEITVAVKAGGPNVEDNPSLRRAFTNARAVNMPKDRIQAAIDKALGLGDQSDYLEILYEGYAPHGIAVMVETLTDNTTRTVANVRSYFRKLGGNLASSGSVSFMFDKVGVFRISPEGIDRDELELELIDHGLEELGDGTTDDGEAVIVLHCDFPEFGNLQAGLEERNIEVMSSGFEWIPQQLTELSDEQAEEVLKLIDRLEQDDDVNEVFHSLR